MYCKNCGDMINPNQAICLRCGVKVGQGVNFCQNCGAPANPNSKVCMNCGFAMKGNLGPGRDKMVAGLLALFLGGIGIHNFYLGESKKGVVKILLCWTGVSSVLALIDAIRIFTDDYTVDPEKWFI